MAGARQYHADSSSGPRAQGGGFGRLLSCGCSKRTQALRRPDKRSASGAVRPGTVRPGDAPDAAGGLIRATDRGTRSARSTLNAVAEPPQSDRRFERNTCHRASRSPDKRSASGSMRPGTVRPGIPGCGRRPYPGYGLGCAAQDVRAVRTSLQVSAPDAQVADSALRSARKPRCSSRCSPIAARVSLHPACARSRVPWRCTHRRSPR